MDYYQLLLEALKQRQKNLDDVDYLFKTQRENKPNYPGSYYARHVGGESSGFREPSNQKGQGHKLQGKSSKTFFLSDDDATDFSRIFTNRDLATEMVPIKFDEKTKTGVVALRALEDGNNIWTGPHKKGDILKTAPFAMTPQVGMAPVEMLENGHYSPRGSTGGTHFGSRITEVHPRPARLGKAGLAAALTGGAGAASAGEYRQAAADIAESLLPLGITPSTLATGTLTPEQRAASDEAFRRKRAQEQESKMRAQALLRSGVPMPEEYRQGGRVRMI